MQTFPDSIKVQYESCLKRNQIEPSQYQSYRKWLGYYWDFCHKFSHNPFSENSLAAFLLKLEEKQQSDDRRDRARQAVQLYLAEPFGTSQELSAGVSVPIPESPDQAHLPAHAWPKSPQKRKLARLQAQPETSQPPFESTLASTFHRPKDQHNPEAAWQEVYDEIARAIKTRHFSPKTLKSYSGWTRQFQAFTKSKNPRQLNKQDVSEFISHLATEKQVSASTQNQAFNALLFVFKHVLKRNLGQLSKIPRAKRKPYIPVVLSRAEVDSVFAQLSEPYDLIVKLLYGCGLRLSECISLRVQNFNFDLGVLTVHDGKGKKDRTVPLPQVLMPQLREQLERVGRKHFADLESGYAGTFLFDSLDKKYKNAAKEFVWQCLSRR